MTRLPIAVWTVAVSTVLLAGSGGLPARSAPATVPVELLQIGSRRGLGMGGDPFLSLARAEAGWWESHSVRAVRFRVKEHVPVTRRLSGDRGVLTLGTMDLSVLDWRRYRGWRMATEVVAGRRTGDLAVSHEESDFRLEEGGVVTSASVLVESPARRVGAKLELPLTRAGERSVGTPVSLGLRGALGDRLWWSARRSSGSYDVPFDSRLAGESLHASLHAASASTDLLARIRIWRGLALETRYRQSAYEPGTLLSDEFRDEFLPRGDLDLRQTSLEWRGLASRFDLLTRYTNADLLVDGEGFWGGQRYLRVSHSRASLDDWLFASQVHTRFGRVQLEYAVSEFSGSARFDVEGWRFGRSDFVAGKQVVQGNGDGSLHRYRVGCETTGRRARLRGGFTWYEIRPSAELESWVKIVLIRRDYERREADGRYSVAALSLGSDARWRDMLFKIDLHQFVHYDDHRGSREEDGSPGEPGGGSGTSDEATRSPSGWFGGTYMEVSLSRRF